MSPFIRVIAQRVNQMIWRFMYTLHWIEDPWAKEALADANQLRVLCDPHLLGRRPTLADLRAFLQSGGELSAFRESAVDTELFAVLRAFQAHDEFTYQEMALPISAVDRETLNAAAREYLFKHVSGVVDGTQPIDDSSNVWWAVRAGLADGDQRFRPLVDGLLDRFIRVKSPSLETALRDFVPDIRTELRTMVYTLSNAQAIFEDGIYLSDETARKLDALIGELAGKLVATMSQNMYLASAHYEALRNYADYIEDRFFQNRVRGGTLRISSLRPIGQFACGDEALHDEVTRLVAALRSTKNQRSLVLVYGPSSIGKTFLVEQLFDAFGQAASYSSRHIICSSTLDMEAEIARAVTDAAHSGQDPPFIFLDEADIELPESLFPTLLRLAETGKIRDGVPELPAFVLFWGGGKCESLERLRQFLRERQGSSAFQKGLDVFNRTTHRIELSPRLLRHRSHKVALGLSQILRRYPPPVRIDWRIVTALREIRVGGVREFKTFAERTVQTSDGLITLAEGKVSRVELAVEA